MLNKDQVVLVDEDDRKTGLMDKLEAHKDGGKLHRAISVLMYREGEKGKEILLQKRSKFKPLWPLFWSNTVCTHPIDGEEYLGCAARRLDEEMGIKIAPNKLVDLYRFKYRTKYDNDFSEHELDTVVVGEFDGEVEADPEEADEVKWVDWRELKRDIVRDKEKYTPWFKMIVNDSKMQAYLER